MIRVGTSILLHLILLLSCRCCRTVEAVARGRDRALAKSPPIFHPSPPPTTATQLSSSYIISRLWCCIKDAWLSRCLTRHGPPVCVRVRAGRHARVAELWKGQTRMHANTHSHTWYCVSAVELSQNQNLLFDRWMWEAVTETKCSWERQRELSGWTEIAS